MARKHIFISGRVQGVGFRYFIRRNAEALGVNGWVRNLPDGRVEAVFDGNADLVNELIERCKKGPSASFVKEIKAESITEDGTYSGFKTRF